MKDILRRLGLSDGEVRVYEALLSSGPTSANKIHEKTGIERRNIYDIFNKLIERGLLTYIDDNKKRTFQLTNPQRLLNYLEEKEGALTDIKTKLVKELPSMVSLFESSKPALNAQVYRGPEGIKAIWQDMLDNNPTKEIRWIGSGNYFPRRFPSYWTHWNKKRLSMKIKSFHLFRSEIRGSMIPNAGNAKFLPKEFSGNPTVTCIYANNVVNFIFSDDLFAFLIESKALADNYRKYHHYLWDHVATQQ